MSSQANSRTMSYCGVAAAIASLLITTPTAWAQRAAPFAGFTGNWIGGGDILMTDGSREKIRCKANYSVPPSGAALHTDINCASDSYQVHVISNVVVDDSGSLSGTWRETTRQADGSVTGRIAGPGQIQASLEGTVYGIQMSANTQGNRQSVVIQAEGTDVKAVHVEFRKN